MINAIAFFTIVTILLILSGLFESKSPWVKGGVYFVIMVFVWGGSKFNGTDWMNYLGTYEVFAESYSNSDAIAYSPFEPGFSYLMLAFSRIGLPYSFLIFFIAVINTTCLLWFMKKIKVRRWGWTLALVFLLLGWTVYQEQIRQSLAISFLFPFYVYALNRSWVRAIIFMLIAMSFHVTAIFGIALYFVIYQVKKNEGRPLSWKAMIFAIFILSSLVTIYNIMGRFGIYSSIGFISLQQKYEYYYLNDSYGKNLFNAGMITYIIGFIALIFTSRKTHKDIPIWHSIAWSISILWCLTGPILRTSAILVRLENYFLIFLPFALASYSGYLPYTYKPQSARVMIGSICGLLLAATFSVRILMQPAYAPWVREYQNIFIQELSATSFIQAGEHEMRRAIICEALLANDREDC